LRPVATFHDELRKSILDDFKKEKRPLDKESAMDLVKKRLADYPKQLQEFGEWFDQNSSLLLDRVRDD
jgi:hypothetical protein